jgi:hypothetical protein
MFENNIPKLFCHILKRIEIFLPRLEYDFNFEAFFNFLFKILKSSKKVLSFNVESLLGYLRMMRNRKKY